MISSSSRSRHTWALVGFGGGAGVYVPRPLFSKIYNFKIYFQLQWHRATLAWWMARRLDQSVVVPCVVEGSCWKAISLVRVHLWLGLCKHVPSTRLNILSRPSHFVFIILCGSYHFFFFSVLDLRSRLRAINMPWAQLRSGGAVTQTCTHTVSSLMLFLQIVVNTAYG